MDRNSSGSLNIQNMRNVSSVGTSIAVSNSEKYQTL